MNPNNLDTQRSTSVKEEMPAMCMARARLTMHDLT